LKIQIKGDVEEPNGVERGMARKVSSVQEDGGSLKDVEWEASDKVRRFDKAMENLAELLKLGFMIEMKP